MSIEASCTSYEALKISCPSITVHFRGISSRASVWAGSCFLDGRWLAFASNYYLTHFTLLDLNQKEALDLLPCLAESGY